jgi:hypothetical protein
MYLITKCPSYSFTRVSSGDAYVACRIRMGSLPMTVHSTSFLSELDSNTSEIAGIVQEGKAGYH